VTTPTPAEQLDHAIDQLLTGARPHVGADLRPLLDAAYVVARAFPALPAGDRFEARLRARLAGANPFVRAADALGDFTRRELRQPRHLLAAGAVSSAAVGVGVTALVMWRGSRRGGLTPSRRKDR
jgi:hypothetical protein